jgi:hypothetical protein
MAMNKPKDMRARFLTISGVVSSAPTQVMIAATPAKKQRSTLY